MGEGDDVKEGRDTSLREIRVKVRGDEIDRSLMCFYNTFIPWMELILAFCILKQNKTPPKKTKCMAEMHSQIHANTEGGEAFSNFSHSHSLQEPGY